MNALEESDELQLDFTKLDRSVPASPGMIPVAVQHADTHEVILVAYTNQQAFQEALRRKMAVFWSSSRKELWIKGLTSGQTFDLVEVRVNCEQNSLLYKVRPRASGICHTKNRQGEPRNCYYRKLNMATGKLENLDP